MSDYPEKLYYYPNRKNVGLLPDMSEEHIEYRPSEPEPKTCKWTITSGRESIPYDIFVTDKDSWNLHESECGNFGLKKLGRFCHCGNRIEIAESDDD